VLYPAALPIFLPKPRNLSPARQGPKAQTHRGLGYDLFTQNSQDRVSLRLKLLTIQADRPEDLRVLSFELDIDIIDHRHAATPMVSNWPSKVLRELTDAIHDRRVAQVWVPHLRDGFIVAKVGIAR
jgi:hypothetical protein